MNPIFHRTSVRHYLEKPIEEEKIEKLLRAAMAAPSAGNQQPWEYYVVTNKDKIIQLAESSPYASCAKNAPLVFAACYRKSLPMPEYAEIDLSISVQNLILEADYLELGTVWLGIAPHKERMKRVQEVLDIPEELNAFALIPCGYPAKIRPQQDRFDESRIHYVSE